MRLPQATETALFPVSDSALFMERAATQEARRVMNILGEGRGSFKSSSP
jgi:hypothetical protein